MRKAPVTRLRARNKHEMSRVFNFSAGPAVLPEEVLLRAREEISDWHGCGSSIMEVSHRGKEFTAVAEQAEADLRQLMAIPDNYKVLFLQGGASSQFAMIPLNLMAEGQSADYINTGSWSVRAIDEANLLGQAKVVGEGVHAVPRQQELKLNAEAAYLHYTPNETIGGLEFDYVPDAAGVPLVADMSSNILSRQIDVSRYGLIYAGAQKNIGPAGLVVVIIREDLLGKARPNTPTMLDYKTHADNGSMYNTPPTYSWYLAGLVFDWLKRQGGVAAMAEINQRKAAKLYAAIDQSSFYSNPVAPINRSWMNVPFILAKPELDATFLKLADEAGLTALKGHRSVGGMRASIYNAMPEAGVDALVSFMADFEQHHA